MRPSAAFRCWNAGIKKRVSAKISLLKSPYFYSNKAKKDKCLVSGNVSIFFKGWRGGIFCLDFFFLNRKTMKIIQNTLNMIKI